jgi:hypothetical protein
MTGDYATKLLALLAAPVLLDAVWFAMIILRILRGSGPSAIPVLSLFFYVGIPIFVRTLSVTEKLEIIGLGIAVHIFFIHFIPRTVRIAVCNRRAGD